MITRGLTRPTHFVVIAALAVLLLAAACQPGGTTLVPPQEPTATQQPDETQAPTGPVQPPLETRVPVDATPPPSETTGELTFDLAGVAQDQTVETIAAVQPGTADTPPWGILPQHRVVTLQGYPVTEHLIKPQIFVYPVAELASFNEGAGKIASDLQSLLAARQPGEVLPFLPLFNAQQVMHAHVQFLDFKNGKGVSYLTQFDQAFLPINSAELIYTFQGLTNDGKYYIAAVLPVAHPDLPATAQVSTQQVEQLNDFPAYLAETTAWLEQQPAGSFTPDLAKLDALIQSIQAN